MEIFLLYKFIYSHFKSEEMKQYRKKKREGRREEGREGGSPQSGAAENSCFKGNNMHIQSQHSMKDATRKFEGHRTGIQCISRLKITISKQYLQWGSNSKTILHWSQREAMKNICFLHWNIRQVFQNHIKLYMCIERDW